MNMTNKLILPVESRMQGDLHVRFGGRLWETYHRKVARRPSPSLHVKYSDEPLLLNIEMKDFIHDGSEVNRPNNALDIYLQELGSESPKLVHLISKAIHKDNKRHIKHILSARLSTRTTNATSSTSAARLSASSICCVDSTPTMVCSTSIRR